MTALENVVITSKEDVLEILSMAERAGVPVFSLHTEGRTDRESFFRAVKEVVPLDPPLRSTRSWDALADSMWEGLHELKAPRVLIVWPDAYPAEEDEDGDFRTALMVMDDVAKDLADVQLTAGTAVSLSIYVAVNA
ncbi:barstar family protein [Streptomyces sp. NPDC016845]|uniref:barstar family protein n=1 Tax=Streptomyces sp. NPDC016845 TaxID=3364972 RepID=UPI00378E9EF9